MSNEKNLLDLSVTFIWVVVNVVYRNRGILGVDLVFYVGFQMDPDKYQCSKYQVS